MRRGGGCEGEKVSKTAGHPICKLWRSLAQFSVNIAPRLMTRLTVVTFS